MIALASSGSRSSINSIEPLISAKRAVTVLRSPSARSLDAFVSPSHVSGARTVPVPGFLAWRPRVGMATGGDAIRVPHSWQNFALGGLLKPHFSHATGKAAPHSMQHLADG